ncbi:major paralogous domain-containing protein [Fibrobacter sp. UWEL]|nr:major paralogous domain-containing protein [Fibrobacter sp. UWEL]
MKNFLFLILAFAVAVMIIACGEDSATSDTGSKASDKDEAPAETIVVDRYHDIIEYDTIFSDQKCYADEFDGIVTVTCGENNLLVYKGSCDSIAFDPKKKFCYEGRTLDFCEGFAYNPNRFFCYEDSLYTLCGDSSYNPSEKFCHKEKIFLKKDGKEYNADSVFCYNDSLYTLCDDSIYDPSEEFCRKDKIYELCDGKEYNVDSVFNYKDSLYVLCGDSIYDPPEEFCYKGIVYPKKDGKVYDVDSLLNYQDSVSGLCRGVRYDATTQFCSDGRVLPLCDELVESKGLFCYENSYYSLCDGKPYDVDKYFCNGKTPVQKCEGKRFNTDKNFCDDDKLYDLCNGKSFDPSVETCFNNTIRGIFKDERDDQEYRYIRMHRKDWMADNLNYDVEGSFCGGAASLTKEGDACEVYGRLYPWNTAIDADGRDICPNGWRLPAKEDFEKMIEDVTIRFPDPGAVLKSRSSLWNASTKASAGKDSYAFSALPAGYVDSDRIHSVGDAAYFWSSTEDGDANSWYLEFTFDSDTVEVPSISKLNALSIRCVRIEE